MQLKVPPAIKLSFQYTMTFQYVEFFFAIRLSTVLIEFGITFLFCILVPKVLYEHMVNPSILVWDVIC